ncbi:single-stranded-DNA-specific exonuclease RecJ [Flammeovirga pectinis]|uniref:Single-stranded-DNA-specific exonuclease RecJ n=1 Tax=Flammeovirga pectinis TaxID=2494373 RepID=A0A3S9P4W4_9BACT|nr:single-stranded-DNA-specific exonuclease RecJ [Flammeovirga pectinis]AZQ63266.1 single-stranded-DNA-specific exonuclease RecJ [Flammeovirga pectinis]
MEKVWKILPKANQDHVKELLKQPNVPKIIAELLVQRGVTTIPKARDYFRPTLEKLHDPFLMKDMDVAVARLTLAIEHGERILFFGDYDVDGTSSVALFMHFFREVYDNIDFYIPDKYTEGYGVSLRGVEYAAQTNCQLIISLDCGIMSHEAIDTSIHRNIDFIVCDHHQLGETVPKATAVLNPQRPDCNYPFKGLSGCGVGFKFLQGFCQKHGIDPTPLWQHLDLVVLGTACDVVPMADENRVIANEGIKYLRKSTKPGIIALFKVLNKEQADIQVQDLGYTFGPIINAAGRIAHAQMAAELLSTIDTKEAKELAEELNRLNQLRKNYDHTNTEEALEMAEQNKSAPALVLYNENWHKGVLGIVASRCAEKFGKPTVALTLSRDEVTGSARATSNFDIHKALTASSKFLDQFGGHTSAAGLSLKKENLSAFTDKFEEEVKNLTNGKNFVSELIVDLEVKLADLDLASATIINKMRPFGHENPLPLFIARNVKVATTPRILKDKHLKMQVFQVEGDQKIDAIAFSQADQLDVVMEGFFDILFRLDINEYRGNKTLQLNIKEISTSKK